MKKVIKELFYYAKFYLKEELIGLFFTILYTVAIFLSPIVSRYLIDDVMPSKSLEKLIGGITIFFLGCIGQPIFGYIKNIIFMRISEKTTVTIRETMFNKMIDAPMNFFDCSNMGGIVSRISNDGRNVSDFITDFFVVILKNIILISIILVGMFMMSAKMTLFVILLFAVYFFMNFLVSKQFTELSKVRQESYDKICIKINHSISQINTVKLFNQEERKKQEFKKIITDNYENNLKSRKLSLLINAMNNAVVITCLALIYGYGSYMVMDGQSTIGTIIAFGLYFQNLVQPIYEFLNSNIDIRNMEPIINRIHEYCTLETEGKDSSAMEIEPINSIQFQNVSYSYETGIRVLQNVDLDFVHNGLYAIVGDSGAGKTTLIKLLTAFYNSYEGHILINDIELRQYNIKGIRENISLVSQDIELSNTSIRDNICLGRELSNNKIDEIIHFVNLESVVEHLENGIDTIINERVNLSGGEKQRVAIARALAKQSNVYVFDEPTAALDSINEKNIKDIIEKLARNKIVLIITHNLSLLNQAQTIYVMKNGEVVETGVYQEMIKKDNYFSKLIHALTQGKDNETYNF